MKKEIGKEVPKAIRNDLLTVLKKAQRLINKQDAKQLKILSDYIINNASVFQDEDSLNLAVVIYSLSKLVERWGADAEFVDEARKSLGSAQFSLEQEKEDEYRRKIDLLVQLIGNVDKSLKLYIDKVIEKARIKKGSRLHEYGLSIARAAQLLETGRWELQSYVGKTRMYDEEPPSGVAERMELARSLFGKKTDESLRGKASF